MTLTDWNNITNYMDSVGTTLKTFTFNKTQNFVKVTTRGNASVNYTIGSQSGTLTSGQSVSVSEKITSFTLTATSGAQTIEVYATEDGTEKTEDNSNDAATQLAGKAKLNLSSLVQPSDKWEMLGSDRFLEDNGKWEFVKSDGTADTAWTFSGATDRVSTTGILSNPVAGTADHYALYKNVLLNDGRVHVEIGNLDTTVNGYAGILMRGKNKKTFLAVLIWPNQNAVKLYTVANGGWGLLESVTLSGPDVQILTGYKTSLEIEVMGATLYIYLNNKLVKTSYNAEVNNFLYGQCGLVSYSTGAYNFSNFVMKRKRFEIIAQNPKTIVCLGSSITKGAYVTVPVVSPYPERLKNKLMEYFPSVNVINEGVPGNTSNAMLSRIYNLMTSDKPDIVVIETSINDIRKDINYTGDTSVLNLRRIIKVVKEYGAIPILTTATPVDPTVPSDASYDSFSFNKIVDLNGNSRVLAAEEGIRLADVADAFNNNFTLLQSDKIHPTDAGAQVIADCVFDAITQLQKYIAI